MSSGDDDNPDHILGGGGSVSDVFVAMTESSQQSGCLQNLLGLWSYWLPRTMLVAQQSCTPFKEEALATKICTFMVCPGKVIMRDTLSKLGVLDGRVRRLSPLSAYRTYGVCIYRFILLLILGFFYLDLLPFFIVLHLPLVTVLSVGRNIHT